MLCRAVGRAGSLNAIDFVDVRGGVGYLVKV